MESAPPHAAYRDTAETSFYVHATDRGQGIGRRLKQAIIDEAVRLGFRTLIAGVAEGSDASLHLNESFGFKVIGTFKQVGEKFGKLLDVTYLQKFLYLPEAVWKQAHERGGGNTRCAARSAVLGHEMLSHGRLVANQALRRASNRRKAQTTRRASIGPQSGVSNMLEDLWLIFRKWQALTHRAIKANRLEQR